MFLTIFGIKRAIFETKGVSYREPDRSAGELAGANMDLYLVNDGNDSGLAPRDREQAPLAATLDLRGRSLPLQMAPHFRVSGADGAKAASLELKRAGGAYYGRLLADDQSFERDFRAVANSTTDDVLVVSLAAGSIEVATANGAIVAAKGEICVLAMSETVVVKAIGCDARICLLPLAMLAGESDHRAAWHGHVFRRDSRLTELLAGTIESVAGYYLQARAAAPEDLSRPLAAMLGRCLTSALLANGAAAASRMPAHSAVVITSYINDNLGDPDLSVASLAKRFGMARASLYRQFHSVGGVAEYIRKQRLQQARLELARNSDGPAHLAALAGRLGFKSAAQFSRSFRATYGVSPRDFRRES